jgi:cytochrome c oxidase cbb3-type subunit 3
MSTEVHDRDRDRDAPDRVIHEVDGIQEYDNRLPNWWLYTLFGTVVFAVGYWFTYHVFQAADLPTAAWRHEMQEAAEAKGGGPQHATPEHLAALAQDPSVVAQGKTIFTSTCAPCHGATAGGNIGPNLTDEYWSHGGAPEKIYETVSTGFAPKGMPAWGPQLGEERVEAVVAYVLTLRNTHAPGGKPPQGERELFTQK